MRSYVKITWQWKSTLSVDSANGDCVLSKILSSAKECFHSRGQHLCKFIGTKESVYIRKEFNSHRTSLGHQHGRRFIVLGHQYGRRDVMWKHYTSRLSPDQSFETLAWPSLPPRFQLDWIPQCKMTTLRAVVSPDRTIQACATPSLVY